MANFHDDEWIMAGLNRHYQYIQQTIPKERIVGMVVYGSQNVGMDHEFSDIDSSCIFIPTPEQIEQYPNWVEKTVITIEGELIFLIDVRLMTYGLTQRSLYFLERAYSKYRFIPNEQYNFIWETWGRLADPLVESNKLAAASSICFYMRDHIQHTTKDFRPGRKNESVLRGYDNKVLSYCIRYYYLLKLLLTDYPFSQSLNYHLNALTMDAKRSQYDAVSAHWLTKFLERDFERLYKLLHETYKIDYAIDAKLTAELKQAEKEVLNDYYGSSAGAL